MNAHFKVERNARGKRPLFYETPGLDHATSMILVLAEELCATRDRLDTVERLAAERGLFNEAEIELYEPDQAVLEAREGRRQEFLARLYYLARKDAAEQGAGDTAQRYQDTLDEIAQG